MSGYRGADKSRRCEKRRSLDQSALVSLYCKDVICITFTETNMFRVSGVPWPGILLAPLLICSHSCTSCSA